MGITTSRLKTGAVGNDRCLPTGESSKIGTCRPMTSVRAAGFSSNLRRGTAFGKFNVDFSAVSHPNGEVNTIDISAPPLEQKPEDSPEAQMQEMEKKVHLKNMPEMLSWQLVCPGKF